MNRGEDRMPVVVYVRTRIQLGVRVSVLTILTSAHDQRVLQCWWSEAHGGNPVVATVRVWGEPRSRLTFCR